MEVFVFKSIFRSVVEFLFINSDVLLMRYKFFECRNYGDDNYDKCIRILDVDQKGNVDFKVIFVFIRYLEFVRNGSNFDVF